MLTRLVICAALVLTVGCSSVTSSVEPSQFRGPSQQPDVPAPILHGLRLHQARVVLEIKGLSLGKVQRMSSVKPPGTVIRQNPPAGIDLRPGETVSVTISSGHS